MQFIRRVDAMDNVTSTTILEKEIIIIVLDSKELTICKRFEELDCNEQ